MPQGAESRAEVAGPPSPDEPGAPLPATVVITPDAADTLRTTCAPASAM
jgi:hypothetical protein